MANAQTTNYITKIEGPIMKDKISIGDALKRIMLDKAGSNVDKSRSYTRVRKRVQTKKTKHDWESVSLRVHPDVFAALMNHCEEKQFARSEYVHDLIINDLVRLGKFEV